MSEPIDPHLLARRWLHSREEDTADQMVFRPADFDFPPARGRKGFELHDDGSLLQLGPGPTDRPVGSPGTWQLTADGRLKMHSGLLEKTGDVLEVVNVDHDRLVVRKIK